jgi:hypothetical protein
MADLSNMLGDVYGDGPDDEPVRREPPADGRSVAPDWADESVLDAAFANWTPGPPLDAPAAERDVFAHPADPASAAPLPDDLAAALSEALVGAPATEVVAVTPLPLLDPPPEAAASWTEIAAARHALAEDHDPFAGAPALTAPLRWQRGDDDILPRRSSSTHRPRGGISFRRK